MAVTWQWDKKVGEATIEQTIHGETREFTLTLYNGNCHLIMLHEFTEDDVEKYNMYAFFVDKDHLHRCLGLKENVDGDYYNMFGDPGISFGKLTKLRLNKKKCRYLKDIITAFIMAFDNITIEIYSED